MVKAQATNFQQQLLAQSAAFQQQLLAQAALHEANTQRILDRISQTLPRGTPSEPPAAAGAKRSLPIEESGSGTKRHCIEPSQQTSGPSAGTADFKIGNFYTVKEAYKEFLRISSIPHGQRGRRGGSKNTHSMALSKFRLGLGKTGGTSGA